MKKIILYIIAIFILAFAVQSVVTYTSPQLSVTLVSQSPDPVEPGEIVTVKFKIENAGTQSTEDAIVSIKPQFPFSIYGDVTEKNIGKLRAGTTGADAEIVKFKLKVADDAVEANTELELKVKAGDSTRSYTNNEFLIDIQTRDAILEISSIKYEPEQVPPGGQADIKITVKNLADSLLKDITFNLDFSSDDLPLAPYQSTSQRQIAVLNPNHQLPLIFKVIAKPDATPGLYKVPLNMSYNDAQGNSYSVSEILAISIGDVPKLNTYIKKSAVMQNKAAGVVTIEVANSGATNVKFFELEILDSEQFSLVSTTNYFYIGDVDSDDTESEEITLYIKTKENIVNVPISIKYSDANNNQYSETLELPLNLYSTSQLTKFGVLAKSNNSLWVIIIILGLVGFFIYRKQPKWLPKILKKKVDKTKI